MLIPSTINAFQKTLSSFKFIPAKSFSEAFAQERYKKKMEVPNSNAVDVLARECWSVWLATDEGLPNIQLPHGNWYRARMSLHRDLLPVRLNEIEFPKGTEFIPTAGNNSIEARLSSSRWTSTHDNFSLMAGVCYGHKALKRAVRRRYTNWFSRKGFDITSRQADAFLWERFRSHPRPAFAIFSWKLSRVVLITQGSRFSTVPKNNEKRRPINIEPFGNILTQRAVGVFLRSEIHRLYGVDLNSLAETHRLRICDVDGIATIDLKNASDSVSLELCKFLLPKNLYSIIERCRSSMVLGPDGSYHITKKVSSMGNGFTFELMTLILMTICRTLDSQSTVFGDDIIIERSRAQELISILENVGFEINKEKSFIDGDFRESCGANFHRTEGYIESYDFMYPESIGDCVVIWNKVVRLASIYPSFRLLQHSLGRSLPSALQGGPNYEFQACDSLDLVGFRVLGQDASVDFPLYFVTPKFEGITPNRALRVRLQELCYDPDGFKLVPGFEYKSKLRSPTLKCLNERRHWAKYEMYLASMRRAKDVVSNEGEWTRVWFVTSGRESFRVSALMT